MKNAIAVNKHKKHKNTKNTKNTRNTRNTTKITERTIVTATNNAIATTRIMIGATKSFEADPGSIRGDFGLGFSENIIHASDSQESFDHESRVAFE